jgi:hypothetical protein
MPPSVAGDREGIEAGLARGLELAGWDVLGVPKTMQLIADRKDLGDCASDICTLEIGRLTKAPYLVRAGVKLGKNKYTVSLTLLDTANPSKPLVREDEDCLDQDPACPPVAEKISHAARMLGRKGIKLMQESGVLSTRTPAVATATAPTGPGPFPVATDPNGTSPSGVILPPLEETKTPTRGLSIAGWTAVGGGLALLATSGVFFLYLDGKENDCQTTPAGNRCFQLYNGKPGGYVFGGLGLVSAAVGAYILLGPGSAHPTKVALTPNGILLRGAF